MISFNLPFISIFDNTFWLGCNNWSCLFWNTIFSLIQRRNNFLLFGHKRSKSESQTDSYICPIEPPLSQNGKDSLVNGGTANYPQNNGCIKEVSSNFKFLFFQKKNSGRVSKLCHEIFLLLFAFVFGVIHGFDLIVCILLV